MHTARSGIWISAENPRHVTERWCVVSVEMGQSTCRLRPNGSGAAVVVGSGGGIHPPVAAHPAHRCTRSTHRAKSLVDVVFRGRDRIQVCRRAAANLVAARRFDNARQRDPRVGQRIDTWPGAVTARLARWSPARLATVLGEVGHAEHRRAVEQAVGDERRPGSP